jgi:hypothetical protein
MNVREVLDYLDLRNSLRTGWPLLLSLLALLAIWWYAAWGALGYALLAVLLALFFQPGAYSVLTTVRYAGLTGIWLFVFGFPFLFPDNLRVMFLIWGVALFANKPLREAWKEDTSPQRGRSSALVGSIISLAALLATALGPAPFASVLFLAVVFLLNVVGWLAPSAEIEDAPSHQPMSTA